MLADTKRLAVLPLLWMVSCMVSGALTENSGASCSNSICNCGPLFATCITSNSSEVVPQDLNKDLKFLDITFTMTKESNYANVSESDFARYSALESLSIQGDIVAIASDAVKSLPNLTELMLLETKIGSLPAGLLANNTMINKVDLTNNQFAKIPMSILSRHNRKTITRFGFSQRGKVSLPCFNNSLVLPEEFSSFLKLERLELSYAEFENSSCATLISGDFFLPVANITTLDVSGTNFLSRREFALSNLTKLHSLYLGNLKPYKFSPTDGKALIDNLPLNLRKLYISKWQTDAQLEEKCQIRNSSTLEKLSSLKYLNILSFDHSDGIFGWIMKREILPNITRLIRLDLSSCRLGEIEPDAFDGFPHLQDLILSHNPLGAKNTLLLTRPADRLRLLGLSYSSIQSDHLFQYDGSHILCDFPEVSTIDFSSNVIVKLPTFSNRSVCNSSSSVFVTEFRANNNLLESFSDPLGRNSSNICKTFPYLEQLNLSNNRLSWINGLELCRHLRWLYLRGNLFWAVDRTTTQLEKVLRYLTKITSLDLSDNQFEYVDEKTLYNMHGLQHVLFDANDIREVGNHTFWGNPLIAIISFKYNSIQFLDSAVFDKLHHLSSLYLDGNLLASLSPKFLDIVDSLPSLASFSIINNPFDCGCDKKYFQDWLRDSNNSLISNRQYGSIVCSSPSGLEQQLVYDYKTDYFECYTKDIVVTTASVFSAVFLTLLVALPCYKYRWYVTHLRIVWRAFSSSLKLVKMEHVCPFDAYVSFNPECEEDAVWVAQELVLAIEGDRETANQNGLKLYLEQRDALGGTSRFTEREIALKKSKHVLIVVSNSYLSSPACLGEADLSGLQMHGTEFYQPNRVMLLIREELNEGIIRPPMSSLLLGRTLQVESNERKKRAMWREIRRFISAPLYSYSRPEEQRENGDADVVEQMEILL